MKNLGFIVLLLVPFSGPAPAPRSESSHYELSPGRRLIFVAGPKPERQQSRPVYQKGGPVAPAPSPAIRTFQSAPTALTVEQLIIRRSIELQNRETIHRSQKQRVRGDERIRSK